MEKLRSIFNLFRKGNMVLNPKAWKEGQITATVLAGVILAVVHVLAAFGVAIPIDLNTANAVATGVIAIVNVVLTVTTTEKLGISPKLEQNKVEEKQEFPKLDINEQGVIVESTEVSHKETYEKFKELSPN